MEELVLKYKNEKRRYALSFEGGKEPALKIKIHGSCIAAATALFSRHRSIPNYLKSWKFHSFEPDVQKGFGFDGAFRAGRSKEYVILRGALTKNYQAVAISLELLLGNLTFLEDMARDVLGMEAPGDPVLNQFMHLNSAVALEGGLHAAPLGGTVAPVFVDWLDTLRKSRRRLYDVEEVMCTAWNAISTYKIKTEDGPNPFMGFRATLGKNGSLILSVPGNACDVATEDWWNRRDGAGHDLSCHNLDSPLQQLSLIAGLCCLHDLASKDLDSQPPS